MSQPNPQDQPDERPLEEEQQTRRPDTPPEPENNRPREMDVDEGKERVEPPPGNTTEHVDHRPPGQARAVNE